MIRPARRQSISWRTHPWRFFALVLVLTLVLAGAGRIAAGLFATEPRAQWIWAEGDFSDGEPIAFYAVREIELPAVGPGRITIAADETYLLYVNGQRIGGGSFRSGAPFDVYEVGDFLDVGLNRILVELRSSRGAGGLLAKIELAPGAGTSVVTDDSWQIFRRYDTGLVRGWSALEGGEAPQIWGRAPTGRWRPNGTRRRHIPFQRFPPPERSWPLRHQLYHSASWTALDGSQRRIPAIGPQQVFDWGEEVTGFISLDLRSDEGKPGLLYVSTEPPDPKDRPPDAVIIPVSGRRFWEDAHPRRFRYLLLVGTEPYSRIEVDLLDGEEARALAAPADNHRGVFGIEPPRSYSRAEEAVWKRLEQEAADRNDPDEPRS